MTAEPDAAMRPVAFPRALSRPDSPSRAAISSILLLASFAGGAAAQERTTELAPPPTSAEDRAVYALAVDSTAFPDADAVLLLDEGRIRVDANGRATATFRMVRQVRTDAAAKAAAEISLGYDGGREALSLDWARVVDRKGTVLSGPIRLQEMDAPVGRASPVYTDGKVVRASLGAAEAGRIIDVQYTRELTRPDLPGGFLYSWTVNGSRPVLRSRLVLDTPAGLDPGIVERNLPEPARVTRTGDRVIREWRYDDLPAVERELFAADSNDVEMVVLVAGSLSWPRVSAWYDSLTADRYRVTPELEARLAALVADASSREDSLKALHRWVAQDIRYVSLSLGIGGYQPRSPAEVARTGVGDCKDKTTLFIALARHMGVEAHPVLVRTSGRFYQELPSPRQFNHMVAAVRHGGDWRYPDLTVPVAPFGEVYGRLQGRQGLMLLPGARTEVVSFPASPAERNRSVIEVIGELHEDGTLEAEYSETVTGAIQYRMRGEFARPLNDRTRQSVSRNLARRVARGGVTDSMVLFDGLDLEAVPRLWARVRVDDVLQDVPGGHLLPLTLGSYGSPELIQRLEQEGERRFPVDAEKFFGPREHHSEYRIRLPEGWVAELPESVWAASEFGSYQSAYEQTGRELVVRRTIRGTNAVLPPDRIQALLDWVRILAGDHVEHIALRPAGG